MGAREAGLLQLYLASRDRSRGLRLNLLWESSALHISSCLLWVGLVSPILQTRKQTQRIAKCTQLESEFKLRSI